MGRFYRTTAATPIDYMYRLNTPLMEKVIETNDQYIDQEIGAANQLGALAHFEHTAQDDPAAQELAGKYTTDVDNIVNAITKDPANWRKQLTGIRDVKQRLMTDYTTGAISAYTGNYNKRKGYFDQIDAQVKAYTEGKGGIDPSVAGLYKNYWDRQFKGTDYQGVGKYNQYEGGYAPNDMDISKLMAEGLDKMKADTTKEWHTTPSGNDWYWNKVTGEKVEVTPERILAAAMGNITPEMKNYLRSRAQVGAIDPNSLVNPYSVSIVERSKDEQDKVDSLTKMLNSTKDPKVKQQIQESLTSFVKQLDDRQSIDFNEGSYFTPILRKLINIYRQHDTTYGEDMSNNSAGPTRFIQANENARQSRSLSQAALFHADQMTQVKDRLDWDKAKAEKDWDLDQQKIDISNKKLGLTGKTNGVTSKVKFPQYTGVSNLETRRFADMTAGNGEKYLTNSGVNFEIKDSEEKIADINTKLKEINKQLSNPRGLTDDRLLSLQSVKSTLEGSLQFLNKRKADAVYVKKRTTDAVLNNTGEYNNKPNITENEKKLYNEFMVDRNDPKGIKFQENIEELKKLYPPLLKKGSNKDNIFSSVYEDSPQVAQAKQKLANYKTIKSKVHTAGDAYLSEVRRGDKINENAVELSAKDSQNMADMIMDNPNGLQLYSSDWHSMDGKQIDEKGLAWLKHDNYSMSFGPTGSGLKGNLVDYMNKHGVTMNVHKVGNSTDVGNGNAILEVSFNDPDNIISSVDKYYIVANKEMNTKLGSIFRSSTDVGVSKVGSDILNDEANDIRKQLLQLPSFNRQNGTDGYDGTTTIFVTNANGQKIPLNVSKFNVGDETKLRVTMTQSGKEIPLPAIRSTGLDNTGIFNGIRDLTDQIQGNVKVNR